MKDEILVGRNNNFNNLYCDFSKANLIERYNNFNLSLRKNKLNQIIEKKRSEKKEKSHNLNLNCEKILNISSNLNQLKRDLNSNNNNIITLALMKINDFFQEFELENEKEINFFFENFFEEITNILKNKNFTHSNIIMIIFINIFASNELIDKIDSKYKLNLIREDYLLIYKNIIEQKIEELSINLFWFFCNLFYNQELLCYKILANSGFIKVVLNALKTRFPGIFCRVIDFLFSISNIKNYELISQFNDNHINNLCLITSNLIELFRYKNTDEKKDQLNKKTILDCLDNIIELQSKNEIYEILINSNFNFMIYLIQFLQYNMITYIQNENLLYSAIKFLNSFIKNGTYSSIQQILSYNLLELYSILYKNKKCLNNSKNDIINCILETIQNICEFRYDLCIIILKNELFDIIISDINNEFNPKSTKLNFLKIISDILGYQKIESNDLILSKNIILEIVYPIFNQYYEDVDALSLIIQIFHYLLEYDIYSENYNEQIKKIRGLVELILEKIQFLIPIKLYDLLKQDSIEKEKPVKITFSYA